MFLSLYCRAVTEEADAILRGGFRDADSSAPRPSEGLPGVRLTADPLARGLPGDTVLVLEIPEDVAKAFELPDRARCGEPSSAAMSPAGYVVPASVLNAYPARVAGHDNAGWSPGRILREALVFDELNNEHRTDQWTRRRDCVIPFLQKHGLLGAETDDDHSNETVSGYPHEGCGNCCMRIVAPPFGSKHVPPAPPLSELLPAELLADLRSNLRRLSGGRYGDGENLGAELSRLRAEVGSAPCFWLDLETRLCKHYAFRPRVCRVCDCGLPVR
jgi:Fe-S-cluster containining protein